MNMLLGKLVGYTFVVLVILGPLTATGYFGQYIYYAFTDSKRLDAKITSCYLIRSKNGPNVKYSWAPVATSNTSKDSAKGNFGWKEKESCEEDIGDEVSIYVSNIHKDRNQIHTFFQLWFNFLVSFSVNLILYIGFYNGFQKKRLIKKSN